MTHDYDVLIVGAGPAGSVCAAWCAQAGRKTLLIERAIFPREKVCGDCLNPNCWPILERLGVADCVAALPHSQLAEIEFIGIGGRSIRLPLPISARGERAIKRSALDSALRTHAINCGAVVKEGAPVTLIERGWSVRTNAETYTARTLVAADGRNSTVARLLGHAPAAGRDRVAIQTHLAAPRDFGERVVLRFLPQGYCGLATIGDGQLNLCLVSTPPKLPALKAWAEREFKLAPEHSWRTIAPLARDPISSLEPNLLFIGDAARVVEPFTGEGIYYALASGELAARHILRGSSPDEFSREHTALYRGRLCVNQLAKLAVLHPHLGSLLLELLHWHPPALRFLTSKVVGPMSRHAGR